MNTQYPRHIAVEGPIGVGKTSLAQRLATTLQADLLLERPEENPFLARFYQGNRRNALATQLHFLFQRADQLAELREREQTSGYQVADFLFAKDRLFAQINLDHNELPLYERVHQQLTLEDAPVPDLVIYLQAPVNVLRQRISRRGVEFEQTMRKNYLNTLCETYAQFFHEYNDSPLLIINAAEINPIDNNAHYEQLLARIATLTSGRHYFNPQA